MPMIVHCEEPLMLKSEPVQAVEHPEFLSEQPKVGQQVSSLFQKKLVQPEPTEKVVEVVEYPYVKSPQGLDAADIVEAQVF